MFERRMRYLAVAGLAFFVLLAGRLFVLQVVQGAEWKREAAALARGRIRLPGRRGTILDRHDTVLAEDRLHWDLKVRLEDLDDAPWICDGCGRHVFLEADIKPRRCRVCGSEAFIPGPPLDRAPLARFLGLTPVELEDRIAEVVKKREEMIRNTLAWRRKQYGRAREKDVVRLYAGRRWDLAEDLTREAVREVALDPERYHGLSVEAAWRRSLPGGEPVVSVVGRVTGVYADEFAEYQKKGYSRAEIYRMRVGRYGVEAALDDRLAPTSGYRIESRNARGAVTEVVEEVPAKDGETIRLSLDLGLQALMREELRRACAEHRATGGALVALDPRNGEVIVLADCQLAEKKVPHLALQPVVPGSVFKVATAIAGLGAGTLDPREEFFCGKSYHGIRCSHGRGHGRIRLAEALEDSCNQYFAHAGEVLGIDGLALWGRRLGFGQRTGIELVRERPGVLPDRAWRAEQFEKNPEFWKDPGFHAGEVRQVGFGKGALLTTPLQVARLMAVVANGGRLVRPTLLLGGGGSGERVADAGHVALVRAGLEAVVDRGTAARTSLDRFRAAAKTGTAELVARERRHMAWLAGYAPREAPRVAFACVIHETGAYGADAAGPVVGAFLEEYLGR